MLFSFFFFILFPATGRDSWPLFSVECAKVGWEDKRSLQRTTCHGAAHIFYFKMFLCFFKETKGRDENIKKKTKSARSKLDPI